MQIFTELYTNDLDTSLFVPLSISKLHIFAQLGNNRGTLKRPLFLSTKRIPFFEFLSRILNT